MISFLDHESPPIPDQIAKAHDQFINARLMEALIERFGEMPPLEEITEHLVCAVDTDHVKHFVWCDVKPVMGEMLDMSGILCSIKPPSIYNPNTEKQ